MSLARSPGYSPWVAGIVTSSPAAQAVGRPAAYGWNGTAWHVIPMPRVFLTRPPWLAVAASGEAWLVGAGTKRVHR